MKRKFILTAYILLATVFLLQSKAQIISSTTFQKTEPVAVNTINQGILVIELELGPSPVILTNMEFNSNGSTNPPNDITAAKLWHYNDSASLITSQATLIGTYVNPWMTNYTFITAPNANYSGLSSYSGLLPNQKNYVWVTYDISAGAVVCDFVDAEFLTFSANGAPPLPAFAAPPGSREIGGPCATAVEDPENFVSVRVFPVPANDDLYITFHNQKHGTAEINLIDPSGRKINLYKGVAGSDHMHFSLRNYAAGNYYIEINLNGKSRKVKFTRI